jgi:hypothetical protein
LDAPSDTPKAFGNDGSFVKTSAHGRWSMTLVIGAYFFLIAFILAHLEIQIEGPHGWAEKLPTWRWDGPGVRRWVGKPVTGYHLCLVTCIVLFLHVPQFYGGSWEREADLLAMFFLLTVTWDFLWFACNRHFGVGRFRKGQIWWFPAWTLGVPRPYLLGIALSLWAALAPALWTGAWMERAKQWGIVFCVLLALTVIVTAFTLRPRRRESAAPRKVQPAAKAKQK